MRTPLAAVVAHQGGWDEILFILGPIAVVVVLLALAKRRVESMARPAEQHAEQHAERDPRVEPADGGRVSDRDDARSPRPPT